MTLGDLISNYLAAGNTMADFSRDSGLSRAYAYLLIKNKSNGGGKITPSIDTVKKVSKGIHIPFDAVIQMLDDDMVIRIEEKKEKNIDQELLTAYHAAPEYIQDAICSILQIGRK